MKKPIVAFALCVSTLAACATHVGRTPEAPRVRAAETAYSVRAAVEFSPAHWPQRLLADLYVPEGAGPFPAVVTVHGGGWDSRDRSDMDGIARQLAERGYVVANIQYRLAPQALHPAQLDDLRVAIRWLRAQASALRVDPRRIGGWGYSAGAQLVALAAMSAGGDAPSRLQAVVAGGTPSNFLAYPRSPIIARVMGGSYAEQPQRWVETSPLTHVSPDDPPTFLYHGDWDRLVYPRDSVAFFEALEREGVPAELYRLRFRGHIASFLFGGGAEAAGIDFLDRHLRAPAR